MSPKRVQKTILYFNKFEEMLLYVFDVLQNLFLCYFPPSQKVFCERKMSAAVFRERKMSAKVFREWKMSADVFHER